MIVTIAAHHAATGIHISAGYAFLYGIILGGLGMFFIEHRK